MKILYCITIAVILFTSTSCRKKDEKLTARSLTALSAQPVKSDAFWPCNVTIMHSITSMVPMVLPSKLIIILMFRKVAAWTSGDRQKP